MYRPFILIAAASIVATAHAAPGYWRLYDKELARAKNIDLTHTVTPGAPVWRGFGPSKFGPALNPKSGKPYTYAADGFEATHYNLSTDQLGTQFDPPAHWAPEYPAIDEIPATYALRPLVVISIADKAKKDPGYPKFNGGHRRLCALRRDLPAGVEIRRCGRA
jgi:hypothetical protein